MEPPELPILAISGNGVKSVEMITDVHPPEGGGGGGECTEGYANTYSISFGYQVELLPGYVATKVTWHVTYSGEGEEPATYQGERNLDECGSFFLEDSEDFVVYERESFYCCGECLERHGTDCIKYSETCGPVKSSLLFDDITLTVERLPRINVTVNAVAAHGGGTVDILNGENPFVCYPGDELEVSLLAKPECDTIFSEWTADKWYGDDIVVIPDEDLKKRKIIAKILVPGCMREPFSARIVAHFKAVVWTMLIVRQKEGDSPLILRGSNGRILRDGDPMCDSSNSADGGAS